MVSFDSSFCVLFDYDGLLVDSERVVYEALSELFAGYDIVLPWSYFCEHIGTPVADALPAFYRDFSLPISYDEFLTQRDAVVSRYIRDELRLISGVKEVLSFLSRLGVRMAVASSGRRAYVEEGLKRFSLNEHFEHVVCIDDVALGKPNPDLINEAISRMKVAHSQALLLDDAPSGIEAARRAGVYAIAVPNPGVDLRKLAHAQVILTSLTALMDLFRCIES